MKILVADDSSAMRLILKTMLVKLGSVEIFEAGDGREALTLLDRHDISVLLLDLHMPVLDGLGCLAALQQRAPDAQVPVVLISSDTDDAQIQRARQLGAQAYVKKPFRIEGLREAIASVFDLTGRGQKIAN